MKASALLLQGWIKEDWRAALDMVMKETPDAFSLLDEFAITIAEEAEAVWQLIEERRNGALTRTLPGRCQSSLWRLDERSVRTIATRLSDEGKQAALETLLPAGNAPPYTGCG